MRRFISVILLLVLITGIYGCTASNVEIDIPDTTSPSPFENEFPEDSSSTDIWTDLKDEETATEIPVFQIHTEDNAPVESLEDYVKCVVSISGTEECYELTEASGKIRGRGNTSWAMPKKSYKLKFDSKVDLFGNGEAKTWTLIANYIDESLIRNRLAYAIGSALDDLQYTTSTQYVELYLNDEYRGVYLVCEQVEEGTNRVDIPSSLNKYSPSKIGYLLELDYHAPNEGIEGQDWFSVQDIPYAIKSPDTESANFTEDYVIYIRNYISFVYEVLLETDDYEAMTAWLDVNSFADAYIVQELFNNCDVGFSSFFLYKDGGGKLYCGPLWDFDISSGNCNYNISYNPEYLWAAEQNGWFAKLLCFPEFEALVSEKLMHYQARIIKIIQDEVDLALSLSKTFSKDFETWNPLYDLYWQTTDEINELETWEAHIAYVQNWLMQSLHYMLSCYCPEMI